MYYKLQIKHEASRLIYPVPDINQITGAKYRKDLKECVCQYPTDISKNVGVTVITEAEYQQYPKCRINVDKTQIRSDGTDTATITVILPDAIKGEQVNLYIDGQLVDVKITDTNQTVFKLTADKTLAGSLLELTADSQNWRISDKIILEVL